MTLPDLLEALADKTSGTVSYAQAQDGSLKEFEALAGDVDAGLGWAAHIFGAPAEATNLWLGCSRSVTTMHKDHADNMWAPTHACSWVRPSPAGSRPGARRYAVICGRKRFLVLPPGDAHRLHKRTCPVARWTPGGEGWRLQLQEPPSSVSWCPMDRDTFGPASRADEARRQAFPAMFDAGWPPPLQVLLEPGDMLYLPAMWHHQVEQLDDCNGRVMAVNWWFDCQFTSAYAANQFVEGVAQLVAD